MTASWRRSASAVITVGFLMPVPSAAGQSIADRVNGVEDGVVLLSFAAREGVCGNGRNISTSSRGDAYWESDCDRGPVRVVLTVSGRRITDIDTYVGGRWRPGAANVVELETVGAPDAAEYLLHLAITLTGDVGKKAILPVTLADSAIVWPQLLAIAKDAWTSRAVRKSAVFWVAQAAGKAAVEGLQEIVSDESGDIEVRERAVFALSQLPDEQGVSALIRIVKTHRDPRIRRKAMFWLGQSDDPRVLELFEEILLGRRG